MCVKVAREKDTHAHARIETGVMAWAMCEVADWLKDGAAHRRGSLTGYIIGAEVVYWEGGCMY